MTGTIIYCSDDRWCAQQIKKRYRLKPLILYERGVSGIERHRPLHCQQRLLIELAGRPAVACVAELGAAVLASRSLLPTPTMVVMIPVNGAATGDGAAAGGAAAPGAATGDTAAPDTATGDTAAGDTATGDTATGDTRFAVLKRIRHHHRSYYFDLIDIPTQFALRDGAIAADGAAPDAITAPNTCGDVRLAALYAPLYRMAAHYLGPHQILTVAALRETAPREAAPHDLAALCDLAEHYSTLQQRWRHHPHHTHSVHEEVLTHCLARHRLSQFQTHQLRTQLQRHPAFDNAMQAALYNCNSYAEVRAVLS